MRRSQWLLNVRRRPAALETSEVHNETYWRLHMKGPQEFPSRSYAGLAADDLGRGDDRPPLLLLHGTTFDRRMWRPALTELETVDPGRRALAIDLPGHGESPESSSYTLSALAERIHAAVVEADLKDPVVVGHSGAAGTATLHAVEHPTRG